MSFKEDVSILEANFGAKIFKTVLMLNGLENICLKNQSCGADFPNLTPLFLFIAHTVIYIYSKCIR